jgi:hypothetical protein
MQVGGGIMGFQKKYLCLLESKSHIQKQLIQNAWQLINLTDAENFDTINCLKLMYQKNIQLWKIKI